MENGPVILFDGICNLCNTAVQFVIRHDKQCIYKFASLQSIEGMQLLSDFDYKDDQMGSFLLIADGKLYSRSTAALRIAKTLSGPIRLMYAAMIVPPFIRNAVYDFIAANRYRWFGRKDSCMVPTEALKNRFLNYGI